MSDLKLLQVHHARYLIHQFRGLNGVIELVLNVRNFVRNGLPGDLRNCVRNTTRQQGCHLCVLLQEETSPSNEFNQVTVLDRCILVREAKTMRIHFALEQQQLDAILLGARHQLLRSKWEDIARWQGRAHLGRLVEQLDELGIRLEIKREPHVDPLEQHTTQARLDPLGRDFSAPRIEDFRLLVDGCEHPK
jgi:hypothetical protein